MEVMQINNGRRGSWNIFITPGAKVEIHSYNSNGELFDTRVFLPGDIAEYDSFNINLTAKISGITSKNVIFDVHGASLTLKMEEFAWCNHDFDIANHRDRHSDP